MEVQWKDANVEVDAGLGAGPKTDTARNRKELPVRPAGKVETVGVGDDVTGGEGKSTAVNSHEDAATDPPRSTAVVVSEQREN